MPFSFQPASARLFVKLMHVSAPVELRRVECIYPPRITKNTLKQSSSLCGSALLCLSKYRTFRTSSPREIHSSSCAQKLHSREVLPSKVQKSQNCSDRFRSVLFLQKYEKLNKESAVDEVKKAEVGRWSILRNFSKTFRYYF